MICFGLQILIFQHSDCKSEWTNPLSNFFQILFLKICVTKKPFTVEFSRNRSENHQ
jgi:hypothetical protein